jgi:hypothetical protein
MSLNEVGMLNRFYREHLNPFVTRTGRLRASGSRDLQILFSRVSKSVSGIRPVTDR